jgi:AAHS family benzoate transporter-like MFS transporter
VLNIGAVLGLVLAGTIADRFGIRPIARIWFGAGTVLLAALSLKIGNAFVLNAVVLLTGVFVFSAQVLIYGYVAQAFPAQARGTALGLTSAVGRLGSILGPFVTGALVTAGVAYPWGFYFFAVVAAFGLVAVLTLRSEARVEPAAV